MCILTVVATCERARSPSDCGRSNKTIDYVFSCTFQCIRGHINAFECTVYCAVLHLAQLLQWYLSCPPGVSRTRSRNSEYSATLRRRMFRRFGVCKNWTVIGLFLVLSTVLTGKTEAVSQVLLWPPPPCVTDATLGLVCEDVDILEQGLGHQDPLAGKNANDDYRLHLPSIPQVGGITISNGRNVIPIGGQINLTPSCSDAKSNCYGIYINKGTAHKYLYVICLRYFQNSLSRVNI